MLGAHGKDITAKAVALIMAMVLWIYVTNEQNPPVETSLNVPLEVHNLDETNVAVDLPDTVRVKVRGSRGIIAGLQAKDMKAFVDVKGLAEGRQSVKVHAQVPASLELLEISPDQLIIRIDTAASRTMPVELRINGLAAEGIAVSKAAVTPQQITVRGPRSLLDSIDKAVATLDIGGKTADFTAPIVPKLLGRDGKPIEGLTLAPDKVNVSASLTRGVVKKTVDVKTIIFGELAPGMVLKGIVTKPATVEVSGDSPGLDRIDFLYTEPISIAGIDKDTVKEAKLQLPEGILASQNSVTVQISISKGR